MAEINATVWINEVKPMKFGELWKCAESHSKKNDDGTYTDDGKTYYDVFVSDELVGSHPVGARVVISGRFRSKENEGTDGTKYRNLVINANTVVSFQPSSSTSYTAPAPIPADAPF
jgi:hypothetical protein